MSRLLTLILVLLGAASAEAQFEFDKLTVKSAVLRADAKPDEAILVLELEVAKGWHIYTVAEHEGQEPTLISFKDEGVTIRGKVVEPEPHVVKEEWGTYYYHEGRTILEVPVRFPAAVEPGQRLRGQIQYMACDDSSCDPPAKVNFSAQLPAAPVDTKPTKSGQEVDLETLKKAMSSVLGEHTEEIVKELERLQNRIEDIEAAVIPDPVFAPEIPEVEVSDVSFSFADEATRAGLKPRGTLKFKTDKKVKLEKASEVYIDIKDSKRFVSGEGTSQSSDGTNHEISFELTTAELARSGTEDLDLTLAVPMSIEGVVFEKDIALPATTIEFGLPNMWAWILKAAVAALLALLTPCVFPMIPITVSVFTKQAEKQQKSPWVMPAVYVVGIVASFVAIGTIFTALFKASGAQFLATNGYLQGAFGLLFVVFSLSLFGMFNLRPPSFLMNKAGKAQGRTDLVGTLLMGLLFSLTSFTCTAPLVGLILVDAAESGEWQFPVIGMFAFSFVLAVPFFFLALFPRLLTSMPKSGGWMNRVKATLGFLELAFALKFIGAMDAYFGWGLFTRESILWMWTILFLMNGFYLLGFINFKHDMKPEKIGGISGAVGVGLLVLGLHSMQGAYGKPMPYVMESLLPPSLESHGDGGALGWKNHIVDDLEGAIALAKENEAALFIDFTGYT